MRRARSRQDILGNFFHRGAFLSLRPQKKRDDRRNPSRHVNVVKELALITQIG
jgi:hypothetical protein